MRNFNVIVVSIIPQLAIIVGLGFWVSEIIDTIPSMAFKALAGYLIISLLIVRRLIRSIDSLSQKSK
jgi:hypothetical protein